MSRRTLVTAVALSAVALLAGSFWAAKRFRTEGAEEPALPISGGGVTIAWAPPTAGALARQPGGAARDYVIETDVLRLVVGNDGAGMERHQRFGSLIDLGLRKDIADELIELSTVLYAAGSQIPLRVLGVDIAKAGERPVLAVEQASRDGRFELRTELRLAPRQSSVELVTQVTNLSGKRQSAIQAGDRGRFPGTPAFAPRLGHVHLATRADVPWFGRSGSRLSYGLVFPDYPAHTAFHFDVVGPIGEVSLGRSFDLAAGASAEYRREAVVVEGGLGSLAEIAWRLLGKPVGHVRGVLRPPQAWATISARHADGRTVLAVPAEADGSFELPLPPGEYRFVLQSPGGEDEELGKVNAGAELRLNLVPPSPGTLSYLLTDQAQKPLAGRLVIRGVPPTKDPDLVPGDGEAGSKNMLYSLTGAGAVQLPAGRYDVLATRGPEYSMPRQEVEINADLGATFHGELARVVDTSGYLAGDFHVHAAPSKDSNVSLTDRVLTLAAEGIEVVAATDHDHVTDYTEPLRLQRQSGNMTFMPGVEITTPGWGHFNAYPYPLGVEVPPSQDASPLELFSIARARAPQAVLQVNHPRMPGVGYFNRGELDTKTGVAESPDFSFAFDTLEVTNGFDLEDPKVLERNLREWFELMNVGHRYTAVGNSDSHRVVFQWAGWPRTYVRVPDQDPAQVSPAEVARALAGGHATVSCGIFVLPLANGSAGPGDTVQGTRASLAISLRAPEWIDISRVQIYGNGAKLEERQREVPLSRSVWNLEVDLEVEADTAIVVVARGDKFMNDALPGKWIKPFGFANPILVDADADGAFTPPGP